ncbi:MAG TPA: DUF3788 domain-containing protein [Thermoguttaceae bacterium]
MSQLALRLTDGAKKPTAKMLSAWMGQRNYKRWIQILKFIDTNYPGIFEPEWLFAGKKHGWWLRFKKSKSFCSLIPEYKQCKIQIVFGTEERKKVEAILPELHPQVRDAYSSATTFHDGKWVGIVLDSNAVLKSVERLLFIKRTPKVR